ncbi:LOW QUALITY PROTEIN: cation channel sperm-associated targeting subunit tau [Callospermophilus lateralis]|uniref:LOW QUALITY PROTEIN: cation channel sperm-associated targeting subunit tau n=1 Tax=Callospermophilus lateralis TaxID=76772 RepID=UPI0040386E9F
MSQKPAAPALAASRQEPSGSAWLHVREAKRAKGCESSLDCAGAVASGQLSRHRQAPAEHGGMAQPHDTRQIPASLPADTHSGALKLPTAADNRSGRVHSLFTDPVLKRSTLAIPEAIHLRTSDGKPVELRGSETTYFRSAQEAERSSGVTDKEKETTGHRLLKMLRKTLQGSESEELEIAPSELPSLVPFGDVVGCLAVHVKNCRNFAQRITSQPFIDLFIRISVNSIMKSTKRRILLLRSSEKSTVVRFDEIKYFSVQVPRRQDDTRNNISLELMQHSKTEVYPVLLGNAEVHLYEVIQKGCFTEELQLLNKNTFICRLEVEFMFSYGNFGYGFSHQLKPLQKIVEPSMFMNIAPPPERTDPLTNVITPRPVEYPAFLSPDLNVTVGTPTTSKETNQTPVVRLEKLEQQPRERLEKMKKEYRNLGTWKEKVDYLENILNPKLEPKASSESNLDEDLESESNDLDEEKPENITTLYIPVKNNEPEITPSELLGDDNKEGIPTSTSSLLDQDYSILATPESVMSTPLPSDSLLPSIPRQEKTLLNKIPFFSEGQSEVMPEERRSIPFLSDAKSDDTHRSILKAISALSEVAFSSKEYFPSHFRPEYIELKPKYQNFLFILQFQKFNKGGFDPFLRNINKMSVRKRKDQDIYQFRNVLSQEVIEHEDQDPPYPTRSKPGGYSSVSWAHDPDTIPKKNKSACDPTINAMKTLDPKSKPAHDPAVNTMKTLDPNNKLKEKLPSLTLPSLREPPMTGNINTFCLSKSLNFTPHIENLKQSIVLKSILSKNLQDLSDKLFSKPEICLNTEAMKKSSSSHLCIQDKPVSDLEIKALEPIQDLNCQLSEKDISKSKSLLNQVIKNITSDLLSEGKPGKSPDVEDVVSEADGIDFSMKKKSCFKKKHITSEVSSPMLGFSGSIHDYIIKQIFTAPIFSLLEKSMKELSETQMNLQDQLLKSWETKLSSNILVNYGDKDDEIELPQPKSVISEIIQAFPIDTLLESGIIKVMELDKEQQVGALVDTEKSSSEETLRDSTEDDSEIKCKTQFLSRPSVPKEGTSSIRRVEFVEDRQNMFLHDSEYHSTPDIKTDLSRQGLDGEESDLMFDLESFSNLLTDNLRESDPPMLQSFLKKVFNAFFKYNQPERRQQPEKELDNLIQHSFPTDLEHSEEIQGDSDKADRLDRKAVLSPKLRVFLEELSESEIKNLKSELSRHIQHYLVERLSESGHITKEDLPKIYQNLYLMNEKELREQNAFPGKYSETVKEIMSFVNKFNHQFIDKHLEIKLRSFLNEILQNYFLTNLAESSLFNETESMTIHSNMSSLRTQSASLSPHDISRGSFGRRLEINMKYPLNQPLQSLLKALSENDFLNLKDDLSKQLQRLFIEKLSKLGLMTERQLEGVKEHVSLSDSDSIPLKYIKTDLPFRDENYFVGEHSEKQSKYSKLGQNTLPKVSEDKRIRPELVRTEEKDYSSLKNLKENPSTIREQKNYFPGEGIKAISLIKVQSSNKNIQAVPLNKSSDRATDILFKKYKKEHGFLQFPRAENCIYTTEIQDPYSWEGKSKIVSSKVCCERTLKLKPFDRKENINICKFTAQEKTETVLPSYSRIPSCKMPREEEEYLNRLASPFWQNNSLSHFNLEAEEQSKLDQYCQRLKGNNNNNKKHLVTVTQNEREIQNLSISPNEICNEKYSKVPKPQSFKYKENKKNSKPSFFPEVLKRENIKPKVRKEKDHATKPKKSLNKVVRILPTTLPTTRSHLRKSAPRTLLHWTARKTIHDCSDRFEDLQEPSMQHLNKTKSRVRLLAKSPDDSHIQAKQAARPYTAPEPNKRREYYTGKFTSPRVVSSGLANTNDTTPDYEIRKMRKKKIKRGY